MYTTAALDRTRNSLRYHRTKSCCLQSTKNIIPFKTRFAVCTSPFLARFHVSFSSMESFTQNDLEDSESRIISPKDNKDNDTIRYVDRSVNSIWQCMKRIDSNLDYFAKVFNVEQSPERKPAKMDDDEFLYLFPLTEIEDVVDLESRLLDDCFKKKFISYITPKGNKDCSCKSDLKYFIRTLLRRLFTYSLVSYYSWRGFRGNFQIGNLTIVKVIFDITKSKFKNVSQQYVNLIIKEWIRYAKQRRAHLKKMNSSLTLTTK